MKAIEVRLTDTHKIIIKVHERHIDIRSSLKSRSGERWAPGRMGTQIPAARWKEFQKAIAAITLLNERKTNDSTNRF